MVPGLVSYPVHSCLERNDYVRANFKGTIMTNYSSAHRILRLEEVKRLTGLSRSTVYELMSKGNFPKSVKLGQHSVGWLEAEVIEWINHLLDARTANSKPF